MNPCTNCKTLSRSGTVARCYRSDKVSQWNCAHKIFAAPLWRMRQSGVWRIHLFWRNSFMPGTSCFALSRCYRQRFRSGTPATGIWAVWNNKRDPIFITHLEKCSKANKNCIKLTLFLAFLFEISRQYWYIIPNGMWWHPPSLKAMEDKLISGILQWKSLIW